MNQEEIERAVEELDGVVELGMGEEALALCGRILDEAETLDGDGFASIGVAIGMFADDMTEWSHKMAPRFEGLNESERISVSPTWIFFLVAANAEWEEIKRHISIRQLPGRLLLKVSLYGIEAGDLEWCKDVLAIIDRPCCACGADCGERLARVALLCATGNHLAALESLRGFRLESIYFEDYYSLFVRAASGHFLGFLSQFKDFVVEVAGAPEPETEICLPGNKGMRFSDLEEKISQADQAVKKLRDLCL